MKEHNPNLDYYSFPIEKNESIVVSPDEEKNKEQSAPAPAPSTPEQAAEKPPHAAADVQTRERKAKLAFSRIGLAVVLMIVVWLGLNFAIGMVATIVKPELLSDATFLMFSSTLPLILVAIPVAYLVMRVMPRVTPAPQKPIGGAKFTVLIFMSLGIMIAGNLLSTVLLSFFQSLTGIVPMNSLDIITSAPLWAIMLCTVILSPIFEEILCRKIILTRLLPYGEGTAIIFTSIIFACIHGNLFQFFYAFGIGVLLALLYIRTGRLRYCITLHIIINALGSLVTVALISNMDPALVEFFMEGSTELIADADAMMRLIFDNFTPVFLLFQYIFLEYGAAIAGIILLIAGIHRIKIVRKNTDVPVSRSLVLGGSSVGGIFLILTSIVLTILNMGLIGG
ncbi:MAG: CPBP family intramembrane metalloprotease [Clostridia bacterium]|nr:CPBP family intramembrane metalloprotease [Clostridia bacterium]